MYQGGNPDQFIINTQLLNNILTQGNNILSVQVHNDNISSSDLTARIFLSLGLILHLLIIHQLLLGFNLLLFLQHLTYLL